MPAEVKLNNANHYSKMNDLCSTHLHFAFLNHSRSKMKMFPNNFFNNHYYPYYNNVMPEEIRNESSSAASSSVADVNAAGTST